MSLALLLASMSLLSADVRTDCNLELHSCGMWKTLQVSAHAESYFDHVIV
jgi:hypothetical protein